MLQELEDGYEINNDDDMAEVTIVNVSSQKPLIPWRDPIKKTPIILALLNLAIMNNIWRVKKTNAAQAWENLTAEFNKQSEVK